MARTPKFWLSQQVVTNNDSESPPITKPLNCTFVYILKLLRSNAKVSKNSNLPANDNLLAASSNVAFEAFFRIF